MMQQIDNILNVRNPCMQENGSVNVEILHAVYGWGPFNASPNDPEEHGRDIYAWAIDGEFGAIAPYVAPVMTKEQKVKAMTDAVQSILDAPAQSLGYDDIKTACTYADEPAVPLFQKQGIAFRAWRSLVWAKCYSILGEVEAKTRQEPTIPELLAELPPLVLP